MANEDNSPESDDGRIYVPLRMIAKNINILLEDIVYCSGISLSRDENSQNGVILILHDANHEHADKLGFELRPRDSK